MSLVHLLAELKACKDELPWGNCTDCGAETGHENKLCSRCYDKRFNDPRRMLPNGTIQVTGELPRRSKWIPG